mmetsp:Transcript_12284/g.28305  ORF Transcript_12284/g.28305 Transcript_12284/m.28305 type:complete len:301 (+) Transcript_12284:458-1360(+)
MMRNSASTHPAPPPSRSAAPMAPVAPVAPTAPVAPVAPDAPASGPSPSALLGVSARLPLEPLLAPGAADAWGDSAVRSVPAARSVPQGRRRARMGAGALSSRYERKPTEWREEVSEIASLAATTSGRRRWMSECWSAVRVEGVIALPACFATTSAMSAGAPEACSRRRRAAAAGPVSHPFSTSTFTASTSRFAIASASAFPLGPAPSGSAPARSSAASTAGGQREAVASTSAGLPASSLALASAPSRSSSSTIPASLLGIARVRSTVFMMRPEGPPAAPAGQRWTVWSADAATRDDSCVG